MSNNFHYVSEPSPTVPAEQALGAAGEHGKQHQAGTNTGSNQGPFGQSNNATGGGSNRPGGPEMHTSLFTSNSSVSGERNEQTKQISISARPEVTYMYPELDLIPRAKVGYSARYQLQGYNFDTVYNVYMSAGNGGHSVYNHTSTLSTASAQDLFASLSGLSALYPAFTGREVEYWTIHTKNTMSLTLCATQAAGKVDIIIVNPAGHCTLQNDLSGRLIQVYE